MQNLLTKFRKVQKPTHLPWLATCSFCTEKCWSACHGFLGCTCANKVHPKQSHRTGSDAVHTMFVFSRIKINLNPGLSHLASPAQFLGFAVAVLNNQQGSTRTSTTLLQTSFHLRGQKHAEGYTFQHKRLWFLLTPYTPYVSFPSLFLFELLLLLDPQGQREEMGMKEGYKDMDRERGSQRKKLFIADSNFLSVQLNPFVKAPKNSLHS